MRLTNHDLLSWRSTCRLEIPGGASHRLVFAADGTARLDVPENLAGSLIASIELSEPGGGARRTGAFQIALEPGGGASRKVVYHTLDERGFASPAATVVGDKAMLRMPLLTESPGKAVDLIDVLARERCLPLADRNDGTARVATLHTGESTVVGRCYGSQLRGKARELLDGLDEHDIHWVTLWDDRWVNKISARLLYRPSPEGDRLAVRNLTGYSQAKNNLQLKTGDGEEEIVVPQAETEIPLANDTVLTVTVGEGSHRRELVACRFVEGEIDGERLPYFKTERTRFRFPPEDPKALQMCYLGIWLPIASKRFAELLARSEEPFGIAFPSEAVYFWLRYRHARGIVSVTSNEDLRAGLER